MPFQDIIWAIAMTGMGLVALVFVYVIVNAGKAVDPAAGSRTQARIASLRKGLFGLLLLIFVGASWATLHRFPIPRQDTSLQASQVVDVLGRQWSWQMSMQGQQSGSTLQLASGSPVEFRVTSADVNHGFAIYDPDGRIVIQTQAMPDYTNKILYTFTKPGTYKVMCLEYCGLGHAPMVTSFEVAKAAGG
ncbi:cytochrome oxidase [Dokdonella sp.]|uniref:cytochrome oxidase n=1 Tax=Dokdonella sp. TaxID=2291710 RepID=UPI0025C3402F|nr:cytochrome oxidase [Dokdonella sp.]MBX3689035.1 cytochrome oxidase [Dokdonella sp.]